MTYLLLNVLRHARGVLGETFGVDHAIEGIRCHSQCQRYVLAVAQHPDINNNIIFWKIKQL